MIFDKCDRLNNFVVRIFNYGFNKRVLMFVCTWLRVIYRRCGNEIASMRMGIAPCGPFLLCNIGRLSYRGVDVSFIILLRAVIWICSNHKWKISSLYWWRGVWNFPLFEFRNLSVHFQFYDYDGRLIFFDSR